MKTYTAKKLMSDDAAKKLAGTFVDARHYNILLDEPADVFREDGTPLVHFRKRCVQEEAARRAFKALYAAAKEQDNRGIAAGKLDQAGITAVGDNADNSNYQVGAKTVMRYRHLKKDGTVSNYNRAIAVASGVVGGFDRIPRFPYCRLTAFTNENRRQLLGALPFIQQVNKVFADNSPARYAAQLAQCQRTPAEYIFPRTAFSTITVNRNWQTAVHKDAGDLRSGFGVLSVLSEGKYSGGLFVLPQYGVAVNIEHGDVMLADVHEWHGNTALAGITKYWTRLSQVFYFRRRMVGCKTIAEELEIAKRRTAGSNLYADFEGKFPE